jgi:UDP-glucose 4-epimerase
VIYGDGEQTRDFVYVEDVVAANLLAAEEPAAAGGVFNIGTGQTITINALWQQAAALAGLDLPPTYDDAREGDIRHSVADLAAAGGALGFAPAVAFAEGMARTYAWYGQ